MKLKTKTTGRTWPMITGAGGQRISFFKRS